MALHISAYLLSICIVIRIVLVSLPFTRAEQVHVIIEWCFQRPTRLCSTVTCSSLKTLGLAASIVHIAAFSVSAAQQTV